MIDNIDSFFKPLLLKLDGKCEYGIYDNKRPTYLNLKSNSGIEVAVVVTTKFNPRNTVRIQFTSDQTLKAPKNRVISLDEINLLNESLDKKITNPIPAQSSHNPNEYFYHQILFSFTNSANDVIDEVAEVLIKIFNILNRK